MRILLVDDDMLVLKALEMILKAEGIEEVHTAKNRKEAFDIYKNHRIDLVLQDIRLKDENGIDIASKLLEYDKEAKIILLTTFKDEEYINKAIKIGVKGYILEPISKWSLKRRHLHKYTNSPCRASSLPLVHQFLANRPNI